MFKSQAQDLQNSASGQFSRNLTCTSRQQSQHSERSGPSRFPQLFPMQKHVLSTNHSKTKTPIFNQGMPWLWDSTGRCEKLSQKVQPHILRKDHEQSKYRTFGNHQFRSKLYGTSGPTQKLNKVQLKCNKNTVLRNINQPHTGHKDGITSQYWAMHGGIQFNNRKTSENFSQSNSSRFSSSFKYEYKCSKNTNNSTTNCNKNVKHFIKYHDNASSTREMLRRNTVFDSCENKKSNMPEISNVCMTKSSCMEKDYVSNKSSSCIVTNEDQFKNREIDPEFKKETASNIKTSSAVLAAGVIQQQKAEVNQGASSEKQRSESSLAISSFSTDNDEVQFKEKDCILLENREQNVVKTDKIGESSLSKLSEQVKIKRSNGNGNSVSAEESNCTVGNMNLEKKHNTQACFNAVNEAVTLKGENTKESNNPVSYGMKDLHIGHLNDRISDTFVQGLDTKQNNLKTRLMHDELYKIGKYNSFEEKETNKNDKENIIQQHISPASSIKHTYLGDKLNGRSDTNENTDKEKIYKRSISDNNVFGYVSAVTCNENFLSKNNQVHGNCNRKKLHQDNCTKPERLPFSPSQNINKQRSSKKVEFENDVTIIGKDGRKSIKMIDDSKPYRLAISLIEKRRKRIKQNQKKHHLKSDINLKQKLEMGTKELIKLDKGASLLKGFRIPKSHKEEQLHDDSNVKLADLKNTEQPKYLRVKQCHVSEFKSNQVAKVLTASGELTVCATDESVGTMNNEVPEYENVLRKRKLAEASKVDIDERSKRKTISQDREKTSYNAFITEKTKENSEKLNREVARNHVLKLAGNQDSTEFSNNSGLSKESERKEHNDKMLLTKKNNLSKKVMRPDKRNMLLQKIVKEKLSNLKKYSELENTGDSQNVQRVEKIARLAENDVKKALGALQDDRSLRTKNCVEKCKVSCSEILIAKQHRQNEMNPLFSKKKTDQTVQNLCDKNMELQYSKNLNTEENRNWKMKLKASGASGNLDKEAKKDLRLKLLAARASRNKYTSFKGLDMNIVEERRQEGVKEKLAGKLNSRACHISPGFKSAVSEKDIKAADIKTVICSKIKTSDSNVCNDTHVSDRKKQYLENRTNVNEPNKCNREHLSKENNSRMSKSNTEKKIGKKGSLITNNPSFDVVNDLNKDKAVCGRAGVDDSLNVKPVNAKGTLMSDKSISKESALHPAQILTEKAHSLSRNTTENDTTACHKTIQLNKFCSKYGKKPCTEINPFQKKGNLLEKTSLGYTAPDIKRKITTNTSASQGTKKGSSLEDIKAHVKEELDINRSKNSKIVSEIVGEKVAELRKKSMSLPNTELEYNIPITSQHEVDINRNYCNRSRLDGDKMTSHLLRVDAVKQLNRNSEATRSKIQQVNHSKDTETAVGFPISVLNTRTRTIKTIENDYELHDNEVNNGEIGSKVKFDAPYQFSDLKDFSLPEHYICKGHVKISDKTTLSAINLPPDSESFSSDWQCPAPSELFCLSQTSAVGSIQGNTGNESVYGNKKHSSEKLNISWEDIFPVPLHYFRLKNVTEGPDLCNSEERFNAYAKNMRSAQDDTYSSETWQNVTDLNKVEMLQSVCNLPTPLNNYSSTSSDTRLECLSDTLPNNNLHEVGSYTAYPIGKVPDYSCLANESSIPIQTINCGLNERCNSIVQTGFTGTNEVVGYCKSEFPVTTYTQDTSLLSEPSNVFDYNHGSFVNYGMDCNDLKSSHVFSNTQLYSNKTYNSRSYNKTQHKRSLTKKTQQQMPSVRKSAHLLRGMQPRGWNPVIPFMDRSFDETPASETSIYMQSVIVQHKSVDNGNYDKTENKSHDSKDQVHVHSNHVCLNSAASDSKLINTDLIKAFEQTEGDSFCEIKAEPKDFEIAANSCEVEEWLLSNSENETKCHSENGMPDLETTGTSLPLDTVQVTNETISVSKSVKNEKNGRLQELPASCDSGLLKNRTKICSDKSAKDRSAKATETILDEFTGKFTCGLLSNSENETKCHPEDGMPDLESTGTSPPLDALQITKETVSVSKSVKNEKNGGFQELPASCDSGLLKNRTKICSDKSAKDRSAEATETILDEFTGKFTCAVMSPETCTMPKLSSDLVFPETPIPILVNGPDSGSPKNKCSQQTLGKLNDLVLDCKVDPNVKERIKYPMVKLSPLIITKDLEEMIDDYIAKNSTNMFHSSWIPLIQSPVWSIKPHSVSPRSSPVRSIKTPSISPRSTPKIAESDLSPPVLSPVQLTKTCSKILVKERSILEARISKKKERKSKKLTGILPSRCNEKSLFETADTFLGKDFQTATSRKRKKTKNVEEDRVVTRVRADIKRSEMFRDSKKATSDLEIMANSLDVDKSGQTSEIKVRGEKLPEEYDSKEKQNLVEPEYEHREAGNDCKWKKEHNDVKELPLLKKLQNKSGKKVKYPAEETEIETLNNVLLNKYDKVEDSEKNFKKCEKTKNAKKSEKQYEIRIHSLKKAKQNTRTDSADERNDFKINSEESKEDSTNKKCCSKQQTDHAESNDNCLTKSNGTKRKKHKESISEPVTVKEDADKNKESESVVSVTSTKSINNLTNKIVMADTDRALTPNTSEKKKKRKFHIAKDFLNLNCIVDGKEKEKCSDKIVNSLTSVVYENGSDQTRKVTIKPSTLLDSIHKDVFGNDRTSKALSVVSNGQNEKVSENTRKRRKTRSKDKTRKSAHQPGPKEKAGIYQDRTENDHLTDAYIETGTLTDTGKLKTKGSSETENEEGLKALTKLKKKHKKNKSTFAIDKQFTDSGQGLVGSKYFEKRMSKDTGLDKTEINSLQKFDAPVNLDKKKMKVSDKKDFQNIQTPSKLPEVNTQERKCKKKKPSKNCHAKVKHAHVTSTEKKNSGDDNKKLEKPMKTPSKQDKSKLKARVSEHLKAFGSRKAPVPVEKEVKASSKKLAKKGDCQLKCMICKRHFLTRRHLNAHTLSFHPHRCAWCKIEFNSKEDSREHYFTHMTAIYFCSTCNIKYGNLFTYKQHLRSKRHKEKLRKNGDLKMDGQSVNDCDQQSGDQVNVASHIPVTENMTDCLDQPMPGDTVAQFYSSLQHYDQSSWCNFKVSNNVVELQYNQPNSHRFGNCGNVEFASPDMSVNFVDQNNCGFINSSSLNETGFDHGSDFGMHVPDQNVMENTSMVVEDGKVYTDLTEVKTSWPKHVQYPLSETSSAVAEMTNEEFGNVDQDTDTTSLCRIANSFSLSSFSRENKD